jgi:uncharacterized glyoxalase superfamily protein PhnB
MRFGELLEKTLSPIELNKRDNWETFKRKIRDKQPFELANDKEKKIIIGYDDEDEHQAFVDKLEDGQAPSEILGQFRVGKGPAAKIMLPTLDGEPIGLSSLQKSEDFGSRGGKGETERQETELVNVINKAVQGNKQKPVTVKSTDDKIDNVISANKVAGTSELGSEPYADLAVHKKSGGASLISAKGPTAPSIAGGGQSGLLNIAPTVVGNAIKRAYKFYKEAFGANEGMKFPTGKAVEVFIEIPQKHVKDILAGTAEMGGPIDYMYIGPMKVEAEIAGKNVSLNGKLISIEDYEKAVGKLYIRIRRRSTTQVLDFKSVDKYGLPNIFYEKGTGGRRIVVISEKHLPKKIKKKGAGLYISLGQ